MRGELVRRTWEWDPTLYAPAKYQRACTYDAFVPHALAGFEPGIPGEVAGIISDAEKAIADLNGTSGPQLAALARLLLRTESIASSKVEGLQMDARTLARAEAQLETGRRIGPEASEILGNIDAMQLAIDSAASAQGVSRVAIVDVHRALMAGAPNRQIAGVVRASQNWIGGNDYNPCGAAFVPPPPEEVDRLLDDLSVFCEGAALPPLVQAALAHAQFETIHPFADGNGRTGRALIQVILRRRGLAPDFVPPISVVLAREKERYIAGLTAFRDDDISGWLGTFAVAARRAAELAISYLGKVADLQQQWRDRLATTSNPRSDAAAWAIIDELPGHPVVTVPVAVASTRRTKPAVTNGIDELERAGVLRRLGESSRNRAWEADGLLDLIVELEAGAG